MPDVAGLDDWATSSAATLAAAVLAGNGALEGELGPTVPTAPARWGQPSAVRTAGE